MLNYETILSSYDDKLTLMQWLKKVEDALKNASAVAFNVTKTGDATLTFSVDFEDGSKIESGPIVLQQGESVASAAITNGHLFLTLTNGDVLDAGNLFNGNVTLSGNLSVTGTISGNIPVLTTAGDEISAQKPVVEVMAGYSFDIVNTLEWSAEYVGACKNGNKLSLVVFGTYTYRTGDTTSNLGSFEIPASVAAKIYPYSISGWDDVVNNSKLYIFYGLEQERQLYFSLRKQGNKLVLAIRGPQDASLTDGNTYFFRYEATFLLSDNLAA